MRLYGSSRGSWAEVLGVRWTGFLGCLSMVRGVVERRDDVIWTSTRNSLLRVLRELGVVGRGLKRGEGGSEIGISSSLRFVLMTLLDRAVKVYACK